MINSFDIEVAPNFFCVTFMNYITEEKVYFEISSRRDDMKSLRSFYKKAKRGKLISFNGNHYDIPMMEFIMANNPTTQEIDNFSYYLINTDRWWQQDYLRIKRHELQSYKYAKVISIDLFLYWSRMLRISKKISLKSLGIQMGYDVVQELPYEPNTNIPEEKFDIVKHYNYVHDLNITHMLAKEMEKDIKLRADLRKSYGFHCWSWDAPKIGMSLLKKFYKDSTGKELNISKQHYAIPAKEIILPQISFKLKQHRDLLNYMKSAVIAKPSDVSYKLNVLQPNGKFLITDIGSGGIHGVSEIFPGVIEPKDDEIILDADISSFYPSNIEMLNCLDKALPIYSKLKVDRLYHKKQSKNKELTKEQQKYHKGISDTYKLCLNSVYGMLGNEYSPIFNQRDKYSVTLNGQLIITEVTEALTMMGVSVIYQNTKTLVF